MTSASATPRRLYLFQLSTATIPVPGGTMEMSTGCYLIETTDGRHILVDSGLPPGYTPPPGSPLSRDERTVLDHLAAATRAELGVLNELRAYQSRTVTQARFLAALPIATLAAVRAVAPEYLGVFDGPGQLVLAACGLSVAVGYALMTRLTRVVGDERPFG